MNTLFISHSSRNNEAAQALYDWLQEQGWDDVFLDLDPERGIAAGERWEKALHRAASRCDAVLFLVGRDWLNSNWCRREFHIAQKLNKRCFILLIDDIPVADLPEELTKSWQVVNLAAGTDHGQAREVHLPGSSAPGYVYFSQSALTRLRTGLCKAGLEPKFFAWPPTHDPGRSPYRGLRPLEMEDAGIFFGREAPMIDLLARLRGMHDSAPPRFLAILGASGAGKSSFLRAGILPRIKRDDRFFYPLPVIRPEQAVLSGDHGLEEALVQACLALKVPHKRQQIRTMINEGAASLRPLLHDLVQADPVPELHGPGQSLPQLVLSIDQAEELFMAEGRQESRRFLTLLRELLADDQPPLMALFTIRSDSYSQLQSAPELECLPQDTFSLPPLPSGAYQKIIEEPAKALDATDRPLRLDPHLTQQLLNDAGRSGAQDALPLLAFTLGQLYEDFSGDGELRLAEYQKMGGINGAIQAAVDNALRDALTNRALPNDREECLKLLRRGLIPWMAGIDPETNLPRRRVARLNDVPEEARAIIQHFVEHRLLATDTNEKGEVIIEPAHEALLRQWPTLFGWLTEDAAALSALETLKSATRDWEANEREASWLVHQAGRLEDAEKLQDRQDLVASLTSSETDYLHACRTLQNQIRDRELQQARELAEARKRTVRLMKAGLLVALVLLALAAWQWREADMQRNQAKANEREARIGEGRFFLELARREKRLPDMQLFAAKSIGFEKYGRPTDAHLKGLVPDAEDSIFWSRNPLLLDPVKNDREWSQSISTIEDPKRRIRPVLLWSSPLRYLHSESVSSIAWSPDGTRLATASTDQEVRFWDARSGYAIYQDPDQTRINTGCSVDRLSWSPDGTRLVSGAGLDIHLWDTRTGSRKGKSMIGKITGTKPWSPNSSYLVSTWANQALLWDGRTGQLVGELPGHFGWGSFIFDTFWNHDNARLTTISPQGLIHWNTKDGKRLSSPLQRFVISDDDSKQRAHNPHSEVDTKAHKMIGWSDSPQFNKTFNVLALSHKGDRVAGVLPGDSAIQIYDTSTGNPMGNPWVDHAARITDIEWSPDGSCFASASADGVILLRNVSNHTTIAQYRLGQHGTPWLKWSPDGRHVASSAGTEDAKIAILNAKSGEIVGEPTNGSRIEWSPDGKRFTVEKGENSILLVDTASGRPIGNPLKGRMATWQPKGNEIAVLNERIHLYDAKTAKEVSTSLPCCQPDPLTSVSWSPDGTRVVTASPNLKLQLWSPATGEAVGEPMSGHQEEVTYAVWRPDGTRLASLSRDGNIRIFKYTSDTLVISTVLQHPSRVNCLAWGPDGNSLAGGCDDGSIRLWNVDSGQLIGQPIGAPETGDTPGRIYSEQNAHVGSVNRIAWSPDGTLLASGCYEPSRDYLDDTRIWIWDVSTGKAFGKPWTAHSDGISSLTWSPDSASLASASHDGSVRIWQRTDETRDDNSRNFAAELMQKGPEKVTSLTWSPDGTRLAGACSDQTVKVWNCEDDDIACDVLHGHSGGVTGVAWSPDGTRLMSTSIDGTLKLWGDLQRAEHIGESTLGHFDRVACVAWSPDGTRLASASWDGTIRLRDGLTGTTIGEPLNMHTGQVSSVSWSPDGTRLASASWDGTVRRWDASTGNLLGPALCGHTGPVYSVAWSPDGQCLASGGEDNAVRIWDANSGAAVGEPLTGHSQWVWCVAWSPDGSLLASSSRDETIRIWSVKTRQSVVNPITLSDSVICVAWSPDGKHLAAGTDDGNIFVLNAKNGDIIGEPMRDRHGSVRSVDWSPNSKYLASASWSPGHAVTIWDVQSHKMIEKLGVAKENRMSVDWSPDGSRLASASGIEAGWGNHVRIWEPSIPESLSLDLSMYFRQKWADIDRVERCIVWQKCSDNLFQSRNFSFVNVRPGSMTAKLRAAKDENERLNILFVDYVKRRLWKTAWACYLNSSRNQTDFATILFRAFYLAASENPRNSNQWFIDRLNDLMRNSPELSRVALEKMWPIELKHFVSSHLRRTALGLSREDEITGLEELALESLQIYQTKTASNRTSLDVITARFLLHKQAGHLDPAKQIVEEVSQKLLQKSDLASLIDSYLMIRFSPDGRASELGAAIKAELSHRVDLARKGKLDEGSALQQNDLECLALRLNDLARPLATLGIWAAKGSDKISSDAVQFATLACALRGWNDHVTQDTLAAALAAIGEFEQAAERQSKALSIVPEEERHAMEDRLQLYKNKDYYKEIPNILWMVNWGWLGCYHQELSNDKLRAADRDHPDMKKIEALLE